MNVYAWIVLGALLVEHGLKVASGLLDLRSMALEPPEELREHYDPERYARSRRYGREAIRFSLIRSTVSLAVVLAFWFGGGFTLVNRWVQAPGWHPVLTGLAYLAVLVLAQFLLGLPFSIWDTFVLEERYGFNRTRPKTFVADRLKVLGLAVLLGGPLAAAVLWLLGQAGGWAWLFAWGLLSAVTLALQVVAPLWLMPLFLKFEPLADGELRGRLLEMADRAGFPLENVAVVDGSRRSGRGNAFFTGFGRGRRVALFDTLIEQHEPDEVAAVLAHEVGHYKLGHVRQGLVLGLVHFGVLLGICQLFLLSPGLHQAFGVARPAVYTGLVFFGLLYRPIELVLSVGILLLSRRREFSADRFARDLQGTGEPLARALAKMAAENLESPTPHPLGVWLGDSHPPTVERIRALQDGPHQPMELAHQVKRERQ